MRKEYMETRRSYCSHLGREMCNYHSTFADEYECLVLTLPGKIALVIPSALTP
jgi:hypothetical protein